MKNTVIKRIVYTLAAFIVLGGLCSFQQAEQYTLTGEFRELADGTKMELVPAGTHRKEKPVAESIVKNGKFVFTGSVASPRMFAVKIAGEDYSMFRIMVENADIKVTGTVQATEIRGEPAHQFNTLKVTGSKAYEEYLSKTSLRERLGELYEAYHINNKDILDQLRAADEKKDTVLRKQLVASDAYKKFAKEETAFFETVRDSINGLILAHKDSWWGPFLMLDQMSYFTPNEKKLFEQFSKEAKESYYGKIVEADISQKLCRAAGTLTGFCRLAAKTGFL
jgi:hypothetical protein